jgi:SAM-dependent methyltransferase
MEEGHLEYSKKDLKLYLKWDISSWQPALVCWDQVLESNFESNEGLRALEIGAGGGGLSLWLAEKGFYVDCTDIIDLEEAKKLHADYNINNRITYSRQDATELKVPDDSFDVVLFRSVLGDIGSKDNYGKIEKAMSELYRVLKPSGLLLFAENHRGTWLHQLGRKRKNKKSEWSDWHFMSSPELRELLEPYTQPDLRTYGFFACVACNEDSLLHPLYPFLSDLDRLVCRTPHSNSHYVVYGSAKKPKDPAV